MHPLTAISKAVSFSLSYTFSESKLNLNSKLAPPADETVTILISSLSKLSKKLLERWIGLPSGLTIGASTWVSLSETDIAPVINYSSLTVMRASNLGQCYFY